MKFLKTIQIIFQAAEPDLRKRLLGVFLFLFIFNIFIWLFAFATWHQYPSLLGLITLAYGLGLRHAVDIDHIAAIDNTTRKLMHDEKRPVSVGLFFSLGHATVVIILSVFAAFSAAFITTNLPILKNIGMIIGTSISSIFLLLIGFINLLVLVELFHTWKIVVKPITKQKVKDKKIMLDEQFDKQGLLTRIARPLLKTITASWQMYFIGFLFGLGFDTASEVGLLSISAATGVSGMPFVAIMMLPLAFTAGMALIDTLDGILMLGAYGWAYVKPVRKLYYNMHITLISIVIALLIGSIEGLQIIASQLQLHGVFFDSIKALDFGILGYLIIAIFALSLLISLLMYKYKKYDLLEITYTSPK